MENKCVQQCPSNQQDSNNDQQCEFCNKTIQNCLNCKQEGDICLKCQEPFNLFQDQCVENCPNETYYVYNYTCLKCEDSIQNCSSCSDNGEICTKCQDPFLLLENECVTQCPNEGYFVQNNICLKCEDSNQNCSSCSDNGEICSQCEDPFLLLSNACVENCTDNTYFIQSGKCIKCNDKLENCLRCSRDGQVCLQCENTYLLFENTCVLNCPSNQFYTSNQECKSCNQSIINCFSCNSNGQICTQCEIPYLLFENQCLESCPNQTYFIKDKTCSKCSDKIEGCQNCSQDGTKCLQCEEQYILINNSCKQQKFNQTDEENEGNKKNEETLLEIKNFSKFNLSNSEEHLIESTHYLTNTLTYSIFVCSIVSTIINYQSKFQFSSGNALQGILTTQLIFMNAFIDVRRTDILDAYYYENYKKDDFNDSKFKSLDSEKLLVDREVYVLLSFRSYTLLSNIINPLLLLSILLTIDGILKALGKFKLKQQIEKLRTKFTNRNYITMTYSIKALQINNATMMQLAHFSLSDFYAAFNSFLAVIVLVSFIQFQAIQIYCIFSSYWISKKYFQSKQKFEELKEEKYEKQMQEIKDKYIVYFDQKFQNTLPQTLFQTLFLARRLFISFAAIILIDQYIPQIIIYVANCFLWLLYIQIFKPYASKIILTLEAIGELLLILIYFLNFYFKNTENQNLDESHQKQKEVLGSVIVIVCVSYASLSLLINLILMIVNLVKEYLKNRKAKVQVVDKNEELPQLGLTGFNESQVINKTSTSFTTQRDKQLLKSVKRGKQEQSDKIF